MTAAEQYKQRVVDRSQYLVRAQTNSEFTVSSLYPRYRRSTGGSDLVTPYQSIGARGVQNLAAKLLLTFLPPGEDWVKLTVNETQLDRALASAGVEVDESRRVKTEFQSGLTAVTNEIHNWVDSNPQIRVRLHEVLRDLIVGGSALWRIDDDGYSRVYHLDEFTARRDYVGELISFVIEERLERDHTTPERVLRLFKKDQDAVDLYTHAELQDDGKWHVFQEINGEMVEGSDGTYSQENFPYIDAYFDHISGEDYARSYVEFLIGDLRSAEGLSQAIVEGAAAAARLIPIVSPGSFIKPSELARVRNGVPIQGNPGDVTFLRVDKGSDFSFAMSALDKIERRLELAFLMNFAVQRKGERVTATEINALVQELSDTLGGVYSHLAASLQVPLVRRIMSIMQGANLLPALPKELVRPTVVAGLENVGRGRELQGLSIAIQSSVNMLGPEAVLTQINAEELLRRALVDAGVEPRGLLKTPEQVQAEAQQAQQIEAARAVGPELVKGAIAQNAPPAPPTGSEL